MTSIFFGHKLTKIRHYRTSKKRHTGYLQLDRNSIFPIKRGKGERQLNSQKYKVA